ncbi:homoserine kinase [Marinicella rhabdoformis]|uniref:homoserine kinase n=1 Tax=Marinicella rhabdoformis TaxID=2580566 RepID=UPI0015D0B636|nr:homoserine kinase [Marinicella rhabdoformis]
MSNQDQNIIQSFAPITIGNFSVGFDVLGLAVRPIDGEPLGDVVSIYETEDFSFEVTGKHAADVPNDENNLACLAFKRVKAAHDKLHEAKAPIHLELIKNLPVGSGLGSSGATIVAALLAANHYFDDMLSLKELLVLAAELEAVYTGSPCMDNVAPCLTGGFQLMTQSEELPIIPVPFPQHWKMVLFYNGSEVLTESARAILPKHVPLETAINHAKNLAVFIQALNLGADDLAAEHLYDLLAAPHREALLPHFSLFRDYARSQGALATGISGSGPTVFAVCKDQDAAELIAQYAENRIINESGFALICEIDELGAHLQGMDDEMEQENSHLD